MEMWKRWHVLFFLFSYVVMTNVLTSCGSKSAERSFNENNQIQNSHQANNQSTDSIENTGQSVKIETEEEDNLAETSPEKENVIDINLINATVDIEGNVIPLYAYDKKSKIGFFQSGDTIKAVDHNGKKLWSKDLGKGGVFGGFDFDRDGITDFGLTRSKSLNKSCGTSVVTETSIDFYSGKTGEKISQVAPLEDICWVDLNYATTQWANNTVLFGGKLKNLALAPQYASQGWFFNYENNQTNSDPYLFPSTQSFDDTYVADLGSVHPDNTGHSNYTYSHVQNGFITNYNDIDRLVMFTSARVAQYRVGPLNSNQLIADRPFIARNDIVGRNYGLVRQDPRLKKNIILVSGGDTYSVYADLKENAVQNDQWAALERQVVIYDLDTNLVNQRFISYARDNGDAFRYNNRVIYPNDVLLPAEGGGTHIMFNVFGNGVWNLHITNPNVPQTAEVMQNIFVWDIRDWDDDGVYEVFASNIDVNKNSSVGAYFPERKTLIYKWDPKQKKLNLKQTIDGSPRLLASFRLDGHTTSSGALYPVLIAGIDGKPHLLTEAADGTLIKTILKN